MHHHNNNTDGPLLSSNSAGGDGGVRLPVWRVLRSQWPHLPLFCVRVALFALLQLFLDELRHETTTTTPPTATNEDSLLFLTIPAYCWMLVGCTWSAVGMLHTLSVWCRTPLRQSRLSHIAWNYVCANSLLLEDLGLNRSETSLWELWSQMQACGLTLFVLGYCLSGLFWLPQHTLLLSSTVAFMCAFPPAPLRRGRWLGALSVLCAALLLTVDEALRQGFPHSLRACAWGVLAPVGLVWLLFSSRPAKHALQHSDALLSFSLPSLMLIGMFYLSSSSSVCTTATLTMLVQPQPNNNGDAVPTTLDALLAAEPTLMDALNATRTYYYDSLTHAPSWFVDLVPPVSSGGLLALFMGPTLLWLCVLVVLRALARSGLGSTLSAYTLATALRARASSATHGVAIALLVGLATPLLLLPELRALEDVRLRSAQPVLFVDTHVNLPPVMMSVYTLPDEEEEEEEEEHR
jgi:hypothetical protein